MTVTVSFFAGAAEAAGMDSATIDPPSGSTIDDLTHQLIGANAELHRVLGRCSVLLDGARVADPATAVLRDGSNVDYLPPFAGG